MRKADMWVIRDYKDYNLVSAVHEVNRGGERTLYQKDYVDKWRVLVDEVDHLHSAPL